MPDGLSYEAGRLNLTESWLCCGGWKFTIYSVEYLTAYMRARKASTRNPPLPAERVSDSSFLNCHLRCIYRALFLASSPTPYAQTILSEEGIIPRLVEVVSKAQQASDQVLDWAYSSMHLLLCAMYPDPVLGPNLCYQAFEVFAAPSRLLLQALRFWWLQAAQAPTGADCGDAASVAVEIVHSACRDAAFAHAWAATIGDKLVCMASLARLSCTLPGSEMDIGHACIDIPKKVFGNPQARSALQHYWPPHQPRCPEVVAMLQDAVISNARAIPDSSAAQPPNVCLAALPCLLLLLDKDLCNLGKVLQPHTEEGVLELVQQPTLNVLLRSKGLVLVEAALRTACGSRTKVSPKGALSMLATLRKAMLVSGSTGSNIQLAELCMLATEALVRAACKPGKAGKAGQEAARLTGGTHASRARAVRSGNLCERMLPHGIARLVALLAATSALDDVIVRHLCTELARLAGHPILSQGADVMHPMLSVHLLINITRDIVNGPAHPASRTNARLEAVVQKGLLALLATQTSRVLAEKGIATFFGLLATDVLPAAASLLPADVHTTNNVLALTRPFRGLDLNEAFNSGGFAMVTIAEHERSKALAAMAEVVEAVEALCGSLDQTAAAAAADLELARMAALGPGCHNPGCKNLTGATEAELPNRKCSGCKKAHYCRAACQKAAWKVHKPVCKAWAA
ncbi:hypothetical protein WJX72_005639 [[Myrmecia] bisecta]|uniref:MYND-type domain-containing protein n=1 Tax=[Myrmecia] bisecta TaxID=41462 RepID=A0AAW1P635_9CHLO